MFDSIDTILLRLKNFRDYRDWEKYHTPASLARAVAVEAGELNELFLWNGEPDDEQIKTEVADVMIYCLNLCIAVGINPICAINDKISHNQTRKSSAEGKLLHDSEYDEDPSS